MMFEERIKIVVGNDLPLAVRMRTSNGRFHYDINPSDVSNVRVFVGPQRQDRAIDITDDTYEYQGESVPCVKVENNIIRILIKKERLPKIGLNSLWITANYRGMAATLAYGERIEIVPYSEMSSVEGALVSDLPETDPHWPHHHRHHHPHSIHAPQATMDSREVPCHHPHPGEPMAPLPPNCIFELEGLFIPVEYTDQEIDDLKADLRVAIAEFQQSKSEADALKLALTDIVTNAKVDSVKQEILEAIKNIDTYEEFDDEDWKEITGEEPEPEPVGDVVAFLCSATSNEEDFRCEFMQETKVGDVTWYVWEDIGPEQHKPEYHFTLMRNPQVGDFCYEGEPAEDESTKQQVTDIFYE